MAQEKEKRALGWRWGGWRATVEQQGVRAQMEQGMKFLMLTELVVGTAYRAN